ncbi:MAG TPA: FliH/SctL family protein [Terracidiphilus sp.]|jgi:flagellar assembly protein FliH|nr:FliH/SctL family protein [Terracidiphilus sp.]
MRSQAVNGKNPGSRGASAGAWPGSRPEKPGSRPEKIELFEYLAHAATPAAPDWSAFAVDGEPDVAAAEPDPASHPDFEQRLATETQRAFEQGRERGRQEGRQVERESLAGALRTAQEGQTRQLAELAEGFATARERYLRDVEQEVVKLALAVAARILRREAQMDPLLLTGAARVALGQLASTTEVRLRVPPGEIDLWTEAMALLPNLPLKPTVVAGEGLRTGDCIVETSLGTVDLGIRAQLGEIERGFFDRAGAGRSARALEAAERTAEQAAARMERRA